MRFTCVRVCVCVTGGGACVGLGSTEQRHTGPAGTAQPTHLDIEARVVLAIGSSSSRQHRSSRLFCQPQHHRQPRLWLLHLLRSQQLPQHQRQVLLRCGAKLLPVQQHERVQAAASATLGRQRPNDGQLLPPLLPLAAAVAAAANAWDVSWRCRCQCVRVCCCCL
jgi:hypothetical protein